LGEAKVDYDELKGLISEANIQMHENEDCSEIAEKVMKLLDKLPGEKKKITFIAPKEGHRLAFFRTPDNKSEELYIYHVVVQYEGYIIDLQSSKKVYKAEDYVGEITALNEGVSIKEYDEDISPYIDVTNMKLILP
jgi:uncharacterized protein (DUF1919 family)